MRGSQMFDAEQWFDVCSQLFNQSWAKNSHVQPKRQNWNRMVEYQNKAPNFIEL